MAATIVISRNGDNSRVRSPLPSVALISKTNATTNSPSAATALKNAMMMQAAAAVASSLTLPAKPVARSVAAPTTTTTTTTTIASVLSKCSSSSASIANAKPSASALGAPAQRAIMASSATPAKQRQQEGAIVMRNRTKLLAPRSPPQQQQLTVDALPLAHQEKQEDVHTHDVGNDEEETRDGTTSTIVRDLAAIAKQQKEDEVRLLTLKRLLDTEMSEETFIFSDEAEELLTELETKDVTVPSVAVPPLLPAVAQVNVVKEEEEESRVSKRVGSGSGVKGVIREGRGSVDSSNNRNNISNSKENRKSNAVGAHVNNNTNNGARASVSRRKRAREGKRPRVQDVSGSGGVRRIEGKERPAKRVRTNTGSTTTASVVPLKKQQQCAKRVPAPAACESIFKMECVSVRVESTDNSASCSSVEESDSDAGWAFGADVEEEEENMASPPSPSSPATFATTAVTYPSGAAGAKEREREVEEIEIDVDLHVDRHGNLRCRRRSARLHSSAAVVAKRRAAREQQQQQQQQQQQRLTTVARQQQEQQVAAYYDSLGPGVCGLLAAIEDDRAEMDHQKSLRFVDYDLMLLRSDAREQQEELCKEMRRTCIDFRDDVDMLRKDLGYSLDVLAAQCDMLMADEDVADAQAIKELETEAAAMRAELAREVDAVREVCKSDNSVVQLALLKQMEQVQSCVEAEYKKCIEGLRSDQAAARQSMLLQLHQFRTQCQNSVNEAEGVMQDRVDLEKRHLRDMGKRTQLQTTAIQTCLQSGRA
eukprot:TRINITY_DN188_c0_g1_i2.p1 TRINITY_DN188_c0_g1~~TRINITY_DN188_c0_g1_i2.p1  ORF type:complete len:765 (-),score=203.05 TRINITY_DN188_c0_g1_i2:88-2382(-)